MINQSHPDKEEREAPLLQRQDLNEDMRSRIRAMRDAGEITNNTVAKAVGYTASVISQYLDEKGCSYPGDVAKLERKLDFWLRARDMESDWGIETIETPVSVQFEKAVEMACRVKRIAMIIGESGIGKTRSCYLLGEKNEAAILLSITQLTGDKESVRDALFKAAGIQRPRKIKGRRMHQMMAKLESALRGTMRPIVVDNAHRLTRPGMQVLIDLHDVTRSPIVLVAPLDLEEKIQSDEQWASRVGLRFQLEPDLDEKSSVNEWETLVKHQVAELLKDANGEFKKIVKLALALALQDGHFRCVEMRLGMMLYLRENPANKQKSWVDLFEDSSYYLPATAAVD